MLRNDSGHNFALFLNGRLIPSEECTSFNVINPSTGEYLLSISAGCQSDVDRVVASSRMTFQDRRWHGMPPSKKKEILHMFANLIAANKAELDALDAAEMGKPVGESLFNAGASADLMHFYAEAADKLRGDVLTSDQNSFVTQRKVPRGVVAAVVPWNFPTFNAVLKIAPALVAGNSVVLKPSELASRSALRLAALGIEAGIPEGVLNVVLGLGETVGRSLGLHSDVDMVTFTGSTEVGRLMMQYAGHSNMKVVLAECGGKSPHIVFEDVVNIDETAAWIARFILTNQGQICSVGSRVLVHRSVEKRLVDNIIAIFKNTVIGDALDPKTTFGPLASSAQFTRVSDYISRAQGDGAELMFGGKRALAHSGGFFIEPTLFRNVPVTARIAQEEIFGPVLSIIPFEDELEATRIANSTIYGLMAYVWTSDLSRGLRLANNVRSSLLVNAVPPRGEGPGHSFSSEPAAQSGIGIEGGVAGIESYMRRQLVWINHA